MNKQSKGNLIIAILFVALIFVMVGVLIQINDFMPVYETCIDDFAVINKCKCLPGDYSNLFKNG